MEQHQSHPLNSFNNDFSKCNLYSLKASYKVRLWLQSSPRRLVGYNCTVWNLLPRALTWGKYYFTEARGWSGWCGIAPFRRAATGL